MSIISRLYYLLDIAPARDASEQRAEQNSLFLLRHLDQADTLDVFELLLCKANYGLKVRTFSI